MDWQYKAAALEALAEISIKFRKPGDWYVSQDNVEIKDSRCLVGTFGNGATPQAAIEDHWKQLVYDIGAKYLVINPALTKRRAVRWNGFMWMDVPEQDALTA